MKKKPQKGNSVTRSVARGADARGTTAMPNTGREAHAQARKSTRGNYRIEFTQSYDKMTERDIELREVYGKDLVSGNIGVPVDMITLQKRGTTGRQTLTALDETYYVRVGNDIYGKLSIRTQRLWKSSILIFVFQVKRNAPKPPQKAYSRKVGYKKRTASQKAQASRQSYRNRRK